MQDLELLTQQFCDHQKFIKGFQPATIRRYRTLLAFFGRELGVHRLDQITSARVRAFFLWGRTQKEWRANTYICHHKTLSVFFDWCRAEGHWTQDPLAGISMPKLPQSLPKKLSRQEANRILEVVANYPYKYRFLRYRNLAIFQTLLFAGLRRSEVLALRMTDVDLENSTLFVRRGKGAKDRVIPLCPTLVCGLERYLVERVRLSKTCPEFFTSLNRDCGFTVSGLKRVVAQIQEASGVSFHVHKLRHTFATLMLEGGCDIFSLSKMMGHADIKTTTVYLSATAEHLRGQIAKHPLSESTNLAADM